MQVVAGGNDECLEAAKKWAGLILECGPMSIRATVESAMQGTYHEGNIQSAFENQRYLSAVRYIRYIVYIPAAATITFINRRN
jgi:hypothetical protein